MTSLSLGTLGNTQTGRLARPNIRPLCKPGFNARLYARTFLRRPFFGASPPDRENGPVIDSPC